MSAEPPKRYHPVHVVLHWLIAFLVIGFLLMGKFVIAPMPSNSEKLTLLGMHSMLGPALAVLIVARIITRFAFKRPAEADAGHPALNLTAKVVHGLLYFGIVGLLVSGAGLGQAYGLNEVLAGNGSLPADFSIYPPRIGHGIVGGLMLVLVALHAGAAFYHQFIRKDNLLARMWFGK